MCISVLAFLAISTAGAFVIIVNGGSLSSWDDWKKAMQNLADACYTAGSTAGYALTMVTAPLEKSPLLEPDEDEPQQADQASASLKA